jgi:hypothetical protein
MLLRIDHTLGQVAANDQRRSEREIQGSEAPGTGAAAQNVGTHGPTAA